MEGEAADLRHPLADPGQFVERRPPGLDEPGLPPGLAVALVAEALEEARGRRVRDAGFFGEFAGGEGGEVSLGLENHLGEAPFAVGQFVENVENPPVDRQWRRRVGFVHRVGFLSSQTFI